MSSRHGSGGLAAATVAAAVTSVTTLQVHRARRRYAREMTQPGPIDLRALPPDPTLADGKPIELVALGDSGMAGVGVTGPSDALPAQIALRVAARTGRPVHVVSQARAGARTRDVLSQQLPLVSGTPDVIVLLVSTNDVIHLAPLGRLAVDTTSLLAALGLIGAPVVMSSLPEFGAMHAVPRIPRTTVAARAIAVRRMHHRAVMESHGDVELVDVRALVGQEFVRDRSLMSKDGFHPSAAGYSRIADALAPTVCEVVFAAHASR